MKFISFILFFLFTCLACQMPAQPAPNQSAVSPRYRIYQSGLFGFIDSTGKVRIPPIFANASGFSEGVAAVREHGRFGYINISGKYVHPAIFEYAEPFENGKALVWVDGKCYNLKHDGTRTEFVPKKTRREDDMQDWHTDILEKEAKLLFFREITPIYKGRRFARDEKNQWFLTDAKGVKICPTPFSEVLMLDENTLRWDEIWEDGLAFVRIRDAIGAIDLDGNFKIPVRTFDFDVSYFTRWGNILVLTEDISTDDVDYDYQFGFWDWRKDVLVTPKFYEMDQSAFSRNGLIAVVEGKRSGYINRSGKYIWREKITHTPPAALNIDYMLRGSFYAASPPKEEYNGYGGWGKSGNYAKKIERSMSFEMGKIQLKVAPGIQNKQQKKRGDFSLSLANTTSDTLVLEAQDSRLNMFLQAKDSTGNWRAISYLPSSWCGNSYHKVFLAPGEFWAFSVPAMEGEMRTKLRVLLQTQQREGQEFISNEFDGSVNPAQFWREPGYSPSSFMDPYNN